jgi:CRISPR-associated protein Csm2
MQNRPFRGGRQQRIPSPPFDPQRERIRKALGGDAKELVAYADEMAKHLASGPQALSTSQIRNVLDEIQRMGAYDPERLQLLRPRLAYAAGRHKGRVQDLQAIFDAAIEMTDESNFRQFKNLAEAIVGYHRCHGGRE